MRELEESTRPELSRFLRDRRARIRPADAGVPVGRRRRVPGLRREEIASLAEISAGWYTAFERGDRIDVSATVVGAVARALRLNVHETVYLFMLIGAAVPPEYILALGTEPEADALLDLIARHDRPCSLLYDRTGTIVRATPAAAALLGYRAPGAACGQTVYRRLFTDPSLRNRIEDWEAGANHVVSVVRFLAARDQRGSQLLHELDRYAEFRARWARSGVHSDIGVRPQNAIVHPGVGRVAFRSFGLMVPGGARLISYVGCTEDDRERIAALAKRASG